MRIFLSCLQSNKRYPVPAYGFWETYFKNSLEEECHDWVEAKEVDWAEGLIYGEGDVVGLERWKDRAWTRTLDAIEVQNEVKEVDLFLSYLFPKQIEPSAVRKIQNLGIPCVNFFCDNVRELHAIPDSFKCFDLHWVPEFKATEMYEGAGLSYVHAPMPCWIPSDQRQCNHNENYGPTFIGSRDALREMLFEKILDQGISVNLCGAGWKADEENRDKDPSTLFQLWRLPQILSNQARLLNEVGVRGILNKIQYRLRRDMQDEKLCEAAYGWISDEDYTRITQQSQVTIGVNRYPSLRYPLHEPDTYSRLRDIEAPMMGACYLTEWTEGLEQRYRLGKEIETYETAEEMIDKIQHLRRHPQKRHELRCAGQQRALQDHTVGSSLNAISSMLGIC